MTLRDQIEARTNAANTSAVWKHLKLLERERERDAKVITSTKHLTARDCLVLISCLRWEEEGVVVAGYCDDRNREMDYQINYRMLCFLKHALMAIFKQRCTSLRHQGSKREEILNSERFWNTYSSFAHFISFNIFHNARSYLLGCIFVSTTRLIE